MARSIQMIFDFLTDRISDRSPKPKIPAPVAPTPPATAPAPPVPAGEVETPRRDPGANQWSPDVAPEPTRAAQGEAIELTALAQKWSANLGLTALSAAVRVRWNSRLKTTAGTACPRTASIDMNCKLESLGDEVVIRILKHELAHLVAHHRAGRRRIAAHGTEWQQACAELGIPGEKARHTLPFQINRQRRKFAYQCPVCLDVVLRVRKFARYSACWQCCKMHSRGEYDQRFQFVQIPLEKGKRLAALCEHLETIDDPD